MLWNRGRRALWTGVLDEATEPRMPYETLMVPYEKAFTTHLHFRNPSGCRSAAIPTGVSSYQGWSHFG